MVYKICESCGAYIDTFEKCDCYEEENQKIMRIEKYVKKFFEIDSDGQISMKLEA